VKPLDPKTEPIPEQRLEQFQRYIFNLSAMFIALPASQVADEIDRRLREIGEFWDFAQVFFSRLRDNDTVLTTIHAYSAPGAPPAPKGVETASVPWLMETIYQGQPKALTNVLGELPEDALSDRAQIKRLGVKSALILPFIVGGAVQGGLFFNSVRNYREWPPALVRSLQHLGQILAGALERLKAFERMENDMRFDRLLSEISATYINMPAKDMVRFIQKDLGRLGALLGVERCIFYLAGKKRGTYQIDDRFNWWLEEDREHIKKLRIWLKENPNYIDNYQYCFERWNRGEVVRFSKLDDLPPEAEKLKQIHKKFGTRSWLSVPISVGGAIVGALVVATTRTHQIWPDELIPRIRLFGEIFANAINRKEHEASLQRALTQINRLKQQVEADYVYLRDELTLEHNFEEIIGQSDALKNVLFKVEQVAPTDVNVLILGETGTGKELIARAIHHAGKRSGRPLIKVNCAALTPNLIESELFGHEKGAFTGADKQRIGRFELADGASLFLDEIGELPLELQPKLLRVLQEGEFERLGGSRTLKVDVRIIAATNRNLENEVERGRFRSDLWYRLNSFPISIPPLRDRLEDIPLFVTHFVSQYSVKIGKRFDKIPKKIIQKLNRYCWPGNIRELDNIISRAVITSEEGNLQISIPDSPQPKSTDQKTYKEMERIFILQAMEDSGWKVEGRNGAAHKLGLKPSTLRNKMKRLQISRPDF
jgi:transcriptional regulator with GAF, ATPase, and Fis domain